MRDLLCSHPRLAIPSESQILPLAYKIWGEVQGDRDARILARHLLAYPTLARWGVTQEQLLLPRGASFATVVDAIFRQFATNQGRQRWGDKTPLYVKSLPLLRRLFPDLQVIHVIRDGRDVSLSAMKTTFGAPNVVQAAMQWRTCVEAGLRNGRAMGANSYREIRYEDLLKDPESTMRELTGWLGEDYSPEVLQRTFLERQPRSRRSVDPRNTGRFREGFTADQLALCQGTVQDCLESLGYSLIGPSRSPGFLESKYFHAQHSVKSKMRNLRWEGRPWLSALKESARTEHNRNMQWMAFRRFFQKWISPQLRPLAYRLDGDHMTRFGIRNTMRLARAYNQFLRGPLQGARKEMFASEKNRLFAENARTPEAQGPARKIEDGYFLDKSGTLPHLQELLELSTQIVAERGGRQPTDDRYRAYFREILLPGDLAQYPAFMDFITSNEVLEPICEYLGFVPNLSASIPPGVRFVESGLHCDGQRHLPPRESQLYHMDFYDAPMVYVIVLLQDSVIEHGPFTFLGAADSAKVSQARDYWSKGKGYRLSDEEVYSVVPAEKRHEMLYPRGTVLFIDPSRCLHYGARHGTLPRYQIMFALTSACRSDFSELYHKTYPYPYKSGEPQLRRMVADRDWDPSMI